MPTPSPLPRLPRSAFCLLCAVVVCVAGLDSRVTCVADGAAARKIVLIAGKKSHGPIGNGIHDYPWTVRLVKVMLDNSNVADRVRVECHFDGWPRDEKTLDDADAILIVSDGRDGDLFSEAPHFQSAERTRCIARQVRRGCGFLTFHFSTFAPDSRAGEILDWSGGYFDWETDGKRHWYSAIATKKAQVLPATPGHPILRGVKPFVMNEEFYYNIRFDPADRSTVPIWTIPDLGGRADRGNVVAWARQRPDGGRGFGTTCGHFYENWKHDDFRRMVLNALVWSARAEVPATGVTARYYTHAEITAALAGIEGTAPARLDDRPIRVLLFAGNEAHKWHNWERTTPAIRQALQVDPRIRVDASRDIEDLARKPLGAYQLIVQNYANWQDPRPLSDASKRALLDFLAQGGGLIVIHFANGAFHFSLPMAGASDWPEYRKIVRRVWNHQGDERTRSGHDAFGPFRVEILLVHHPITDGLEPFDVVDELYFRQAGTEPVEPLIAARSRLTGRDEPLGWTYDYGKARVFQMVLGHSEKTYDAFATREMLRRAAAWVARRPLRPLTPAEDPATPPRAAAASAPRVGARQEALGAGRFGRALDARVRSAVVPGRAEYRLAPITVECWAKLAGKASYNILVACDTKASRDHWELFTFAGTGELALYAPGMTPDHVRSGVDLCDGRWHHVAAAIEPRRVRLYVDGKQAADSTVARDDRGGTPGDLAIGSLVERGLGCDGLIDDVRIARGARPIDSAPADPARPDVETIGLWDFDRIEGDRLDDRSASRNAARLADGDSRPRQPQAVTPPPGLNLAPVDRRLKAVLLDRSDNDVFLAVRADGQGRLFVGGREAVFVYEPNDRGGYEPKREILRFPQDSIIIGLELRGDDLYVLANNAFYLAPGGRIRRDGLRLKRLVWGVPLDLHISFHCMAWGPDGDLYVNHGDPLLNYGDFSRPDHWGHWTLFAQPEGTAIPYTGVGCVLRMRPDGSHVRVVAGGLRGPVGLAFDRNWNLFSNDNDHESIPDRYAPARLLHVTPHADFAWPRGWMASKSADRADLLEPMTAELGRGVPCDLIYYDDSHLPDEYRNSLIMCRWDRQAVYRYRLRPRGASFETDEKPFLVGKDNIRPAGIEVGRGGRLFVTAMYLSGNVGSPYCPSDLMMITRADDADSHPFESVDIPQAPDERLWAELSQPSWERRHRAHTEIVRRGGALLREAPARFAQSPGGDPARPHLVWLTAAGKSERASEQLAAMAGDPALRSTALRARLHLLGSSLPAGPVEAALTDRDSHVKLAALCALFDRTGPQPWDKVIPLATDDDTYLRQTASRLIARDASPAQLVGLLESPTARIRLAGVLAAGIRLTVPAADSTPSPLVRLTYTSGNAFFQQRFADAPETVVDLRALGRTGSYTTAEWWKATTHDAYEARLFEWLIRALDDESAAVRSQAAYFLELLRDPRSDPLVAKTRRRLVEERLAGARLIPVNEAWVIGPFADGDRGLAQSHPPEVGPLDLAAAYGEGPDRRAWQLVRAAGSALNLARGTGSALPASNYVHVRLTSASRQDVLLECDAQGALRVWQNGRSEFQAPRCEGTVRVVLDIEPGSNDVLVRCSSSDARPTLGLRVAAWKPLAIALADKLDSTMLRERLRTASAAGSSQTLPAEFVAVNWERAVRGASAERGRRLFGAIGCSKCHAVAGEQRGSGAPSLADARKRFTVAHLIESVLLPDRQVAEPFRATTLVMADGKSLTGLIVSESAGQVEILLPDATRKLVPTGEIEERRRADVSPMPGGLVKTPGELGDLAAYLMSENPIPP